MVQKKFEKISNASHSVEFLNKSNSCKDFYQLPNERKDVVHQQSAWPASRAIKAVRELICKANESNVTSREVEMIIEETINTVRHRNDLIPAAEKALTSLILDLVIVFCKLNYSASF